MHQAYVILKRKGLAAFRLFVDETGLNDIDIERIETKLRFETDPAFRAEVKRQLAAALGKLRRGDNDLAIDEVPF
jgi:hypothetical protein